MKLLMTVWAAALLFSGAAGATEPMTATAAPTERAAPVPAANAAPADLARTLYGGYFAVLNASNDKPDMQTPAWFDYAKPFLTNDLNARIAKTQQPDGGPLDVDMLIVAQDFKDLKLLSITPGATDNKSAVVFVKIANMAEESTSEVSFVKQAEGWRITDIVANAGTKDKFSLDEILKGMGD